MLSRRVMRPLRASCIVIIVGVPRHGPKKHAGCALAAVQRLGICAPAKHVAIPGLLRALLY